MEYILKENTTLRDLIDFSIPSDVAEWFFDEWRNSDNPPPIYATDNAFYFETEIEGFEDSWYLPTHCVEEVVVEDLPDEEPHDE